MGNRSSSIVSGIIIRCMAAFIVIIAASIGVGLGLSVAETTNIRNQENFFEHNPALPTRILDSDGNVITEFAADQRRTLISLNELPRHLIYAVLAREDPDFFNHRGFSVRGIARAAYGQLTGRSLGGGSTITQQIAGTLYTNRRERTITRKIRELWYAFQMERRFTKNEILEIYLNEIIMGPGVFGFEAASQFFFGHSAREISLAESAILAVQFSSPTHHNPLNNPNQARARQRNVLDRMIELGFTTAEEADASFEEYWANFDFTRASMGAYFLRTDAAPWFSEFVRRELDTLMYGTMDYHRDGYTVHTTLNMRHQEAAVRVMQDGLTRANIEYARTSSVRLVEAERTWIPIIDLLSVAFDLHQIHATADAQNEQKAIARYNRIINPMVDMMSLVFGISELKPLTGQGFENMRLSTEQNVVEGALITLENDTGFITAIVGGSRFDQTNQLIRATQANVQPGSAFKPLYYSAALDSRRFTAATQISDLPIVFHNEDGTPYMPLNFLGRWRGSVLFSDALAQSMNVASIRILDGIGFDAAIDRSAALLGYTNPDEIRRRFPRVFPLGLGINTTSPIRMAQAFAIFANHGREVNPIAIRSIEDRNGRVIMDLERELRQEQRRRGSANQVISPQNAYIMTSILRRTLEIGPNGHGTLYNPTRWGAAFTFRDESGRTFRMPMAGKTGTPQNWSDAWVVGYSPYFTTAVWFGFDRPGNSLGLTLTGSTLAGPVWADYMREIHLGLPFREFLRPSTGLVDATVCARSGLLMTPACNHGAMTFTFMEGTQPELFCEYHGNSRGLEHFRRVELDAIFFDTTDVVRNLSMPVIRDEEILREILENQNRPQQTTMQTNIRTNIPNIPPAPIQLLNPLLNAPQVAEPPVITPETTPVALPVTIETADIVPEYIRQEVVVQEDNLFVGGGPDNEELEPPSHNPFLD